MVYLSILVSRGYLIACIVLVLPFLRHKLSRFNSWVGLLAASWHPDDTSESFHAINRGWWVALDVFAVLICKLVRHVWKSVLLALNDATWANLCASSIHAFVWHLKMVLVFAHQLLSDFALRFKAVHFFINSFIFLIFAQENFYVFNMGKTDKYLLSP